MMQHLDAQSFNYSNLVFHFQEARKAGRIIHFVLWTWQSSLESFENVDWFLLNDSWFLIDRVFF